MNMTKRNWMIINALFWISGAVAVVPEFLKEDPKAPEVTLIIPRDIKDMSVYEFFSLSPESAVNSLSSLSPQEREKFKNVISHNAGDNLKEKIGLQKIGDLIK